ncbi:UDP-glucuronosyltransferase 2B20 [Habropoda laboriosa]|uniref:UDP-glucuronosyltransferase 2B20 n=1 Tax=Habropoda laboriosa TaxID=597456 RepID=A0A0L7RH14_9HYME|nr:PREDICTED: UDP-glucuronosyltransferase 2B20 [Habropoda laboriosa]KOC70104.1 UDP-glucuronosyltransferase 2B20 [Habropoda laboriosa]
MWISRIGTVLLFLLVILFSTSSECASNSTAPRSKFNILAIFAHPGKSHFDVFKPLLEELARRGHDLTVISHFPRSQKANAAEPLPTYKDVSLYNEKNGILVNVVDLHMIVDSFYKIIRDLVMLHYMSGKSCETCLSDPTVKEFIDSKPKFDVILVESFNTNCFMTLVHKLNAPFIQISTHQLMPWAIDDFGLSQETSYIPAMFTRLPRPMNFLERTLNTITASFLSLVFHTIYEWRDHALAEKYYGQGIPNLQTVSNNASLMMVNTHYTIHGSILYPPNVIEVGGLHIPPKVKPLPKEIAKFLDDAREGVLYFNLGSMVKMATVPKDKLEILLKVLGSIPRKVIWKWETDDMPNIPGNVLVQKWLPQYDVLNHPNVKCYFGHGGLLGLTEGVYTGVPMVLMPLYGDQYQNSIAAQARGVALVVKFSQLTEQTLRHAFDEIFNNTRYRENAKKLAKAFKDRPSTPMETAVWWTEYVGRGHGVPYIRSERANLSWFQRNLIDVGAFLVAVFLLVLYLSYRVFKRLTSRKNTGSKKKRD